MMGQLIDTQTINYARSKLKAQGKKKELLIIYTFSLEPKWQRADASSAVDLD